MERIEQLKDKLAKEKEKLLKVEENIKMYEEKIKETEYLYITEAMKKNDIDIATLIELLQNQGNSNENS